jgi:predicted mannosyl-3-phosphoglycerate phosphatase (HAD superfamily)
MVVVTGVDGSLRDPLRRSIAAAEPALEMLIEHDIPVVLASEHGAPDLIALQDQIGIAHPFICEGGGEIYIPTGYFADPRVGKPRTPGWEVIELGSCGSYVQPLRLLISVYRSRNSSLVVVGLGSDVRDGDILGEADVPILIRSEAVDQRRLLERVPTAFVTSACGPAGWAEAILGSGEV